MLVVFSSKIYVKNDTPSGEQTAAYAKYSD